MCTLCDSFLGGPALQLPDQRARSQLGLPVGDPRLVGLEAGINQRLATADLGDLDRPGLDGVAGIDDVDVSAALPLLDSRCGDGQAIMPCIDKQPRVDE